MIKKLECWWYEIKNISIRERFESLKRWFSYYKVLHKCYDFDYSSILKVERHQIIRTRDSITKYQHHLNWENDVKWMNIAIKLIDIILENGCSERVGDFAMIPTEDGNYKLVNDPNSYWTIPIYINTRNSKRFVINKQKDFDDPRTGAIYKDDLRQEKAWQLYHKIRMNQMRHWWD